jgi:hypothetical protein
VHADPGPRVHLDDHRAVLAEGHRDVGREHVDARHVEPDDPRRHLARGHVVGVHLVGAVDRRAAGAQVGGGAQEHRLARGRHAVERQAAPREVLLGGPVAGEKGEHLGVPAPAPRVAVGLGDQVAHAPRAVAHHVCRHPLGARHRAPAHHEHAVVAPRGERLDDQPLAAPHRQQRDRGRPRLAEPLGRVDPVGDAAAVVQVERLEDHRVPEPAGERERLVRRLRHAAARRGEPHVRQHPPRVLLVLRDLGADQ